MEGGRKSTFCAPRISHTCGITAVAVAPGRLFRLRIVLRMLGVAGLTETNVRISSQAALLSPHRHTLRNSSGSGGPGTCCDSLGINTAFSGLLSNLTGPFLPCTLQPVLVLTLGLWTSAAFGTRRL